MYIPDSGIEHISFGNKISIKSSKKKISFGALNSITVGMQGKKTPFFLIISPGSKTLVGPN